MNMSRKLTNLDELKLLTNLLSGERVINRSHWIDLGQCLYNIIHILDRFDQNPYVYQSFRV